MSRAFVKEDTDAPEPPRPERPISAAPNRVTARGARLIAATIATLQERLDDAPDDAAESIRRDLRYWRTRHASMRIAATPTAPEIVGFATRVTIRRSDTTSTIAIVGEDEADPPHGLIAWTAPLARALDGAEVGDVVAFGQPGRSEAIEVLGIEAYDPRD